MGENSANKSNLMGFREAHLANKDTMGNTRHSCQDSGNLPTGLFSEEKLLNELLADLSKWKSSTQTNHAGCKGEREEFFSKMLFMQPISRFLCPPLPDF
jgi:hypothetical protein